MDKENEINYIVFTLGYDLLNDMLSKSEYSETDISYDFCNYLAGIFIESTYYENEKYSTYENLKNWIEENEIIIKEQYKKWFPCAVLKEISIREYLEKIKILDKVIIPKNINELIDLIYTLELNYWHYSIDDYLDGALEIGLFEDDSSVIVYDDFGNKRIFETVKAENWKFFDILKIL